MHVTKTLVGVIDFGMPLHEAIKLPNIFFGGGELQVEQGSALAPMVDAMSAYGQHVRAVDLGSKVNGVQLIGDRWVGAADGRSEGATATVDSKGKVQLEGAQAQAAPPTASVH
jgi:gamma-glutamyltranspeptidase / glutathione hydrolase